ncbi:MAG TPA: class III signal peptide-containing protein [archaeon]|nr:class III signal peptide-containing protein [archaeon]
MDRKGQGALEYLLLIGGAIVVAVIVVTLLLNVGSSGQTQTSDTAIKALCQQKAVTNNPSAPSCSGTVAYAGTTKTCAGTYPNCTYS